MNICWLPIYLHYSVMKKSLKVKSPGNRKTINNVNKSKGHMKFKSKSGGGGGEKVECNRKIGCGILLISIILQGPTAMKSIV